jgi:integrase
MAQGKISKRSVDALKPGERDAYLWDSELAGFGLKVTPAGSKVYLVQYRIGGRKGRTRRVTIGKHGTVTADMAREAAKRLLGQVANGKDPAESKTQARKEPTVAQVADRYIEEHVTTHNKPNMGREARRLVKGRIKPALGSIAVSRLTRAQVKAWHHALRETPYEANRALACLSKIMSLACKDWELRPDNPCNGVKRFAEQKRERFFSDEELKRIGETLTEAEQARSELPTVLHAIRLLALTGMRLSEVLGLRWSDVDLGNGAIRLPDAKAGARTVPLGAPAMAFLASLERAGDYVAQGFDGQPLTVNYMEKGWRRLREKAGVSDARLHDFRHTTGTYAGQAGLNAFMVRDLLGHKTLAMTGRYVERATDPHREAATMVANRVARALDGGESGEVIPLPGRGQKPA